MSRARPASGATISLFPFLAVLLCTMGALLVLLVLFSRSAKNSDRAAAEAATRQREDDLRLEQEQLGWRLEQLKAVRDRTLADLARARMQLAGVEDDNRTLADELDALDRLAAALAEDAPPTEADAAARADLERRLKNARESLDEAKRKQADRPPAYAVVPYEGAHGTHRRPLYIECCIDGVFLQPEGIRLGPADFEGPPGPGNPLASALRAAREHLAKGPRETGDPAAQPYPLLLVRPSGVMAYYAARESIQSWGSEFGYQFVDEDWTLDYPPRDPVLADAEQRAVEEARRRIAWLGEVRKSRPAKPVQQYRAATTRGGVVAADGPSVLGDQSRFEWTEEQAAAARQGGPGRGFTAAEVAIQHPERAELLVLVDAAGISSANVTRSRPGERIARQLMMRGQGDPEAAKRMLTRPGYMALGMGLVARYPTRISKELLSEQLLTFGDAGFSDAFDAILSYDFRHRLGEIGCPVLVIQGENDILVPLGDAIEFCELIPSSELLTMADTGHVPMFERPVQFNDALLAFIAAPAAATG